MTSALPDRRRLGLTAVGDSAAEADARYADVVDVLHEEASAAAEGAD